MRYQHINNISNIRKKDLFLYPDRYLWLQIPEGYSNANFALLLEFIDKFCDCGRERKYGNAYYIIRKETDKLLGIGWYHPSSIKTSKREIRSILSSINKIGSRNYIKIPYKISYIFQAIILIVEKIQADNKIDLPDDLRKIIGMTYGIAFYENHIRTYDVYYSYIQDNNVNNIGFGLKAELKNDFYSENSVFNKVVGRK